MRSSPTDNKTLLRIQQEINEVAERENELRNNTQVSNGPLNGSISARTPSPIDHDHPPPPATLTRAVSTSALNTIITPVSNGITARRFIPNTTKGVMQKFFKSRGKIAAAASLTKNGNVAWQPPANGNASPTWQSSTDVSSPTLSLIPSDKPLRKGYVPVEERIQKELREMKNREDELRVIRRKSQPDLMAALESESSSRSSSPIGRLRPARSYSQLLDDDLPEDTMSAPPSLRPARSLAELCNAADEEIESPRSLIQQWESRIKQLNEHTAAV